MATTTTTTTTTTTLARTSSSHLLSSRHSSSAALHSLHPAPHSRPANPKPGGVVSAVGAGATGCHSASSPFEALGSDLCCSILSHVAGESLHRPITTDAYRFLLPFAVASRSHYRLVTDAVVGLYILPLNFTLDPSGHRRRPPPFPPALLLPPTPVSPSSSSLSLTASDTTANNNSDNNDNIATGATATDNVSNSNSNSSNTVTASSGLSLPDPSSPTTARPVSVSQLVLPAAPVPTALDRHLPPAAAHLSSLRVLHLFRNSQVCDEALSAIASAAPRLTELRLRANRSLTVVALRALRRCAHLSILDLSYCLGLSDECAPALAALPSLHTLLLAYWPISDAFVATLASSLSLRDLCLTACSALTPAACMHLARANRLIALRFRSSPSLDVEALQHLSSLSTLRTLDVALSRLVSDSALCALSDPTRQPQLTKLTFSQCSAITDQGVLALCANHNVRTLDLSFCHHVTDASAAALARLPYLESVDLSGCRNLSDAAVQTLASLPWLRRIGLARCTGLTDRAAAALCEAANKPLEMVDVRNCFAISGDALEELDKACVQLLRSP